MRTILLATVTLAGVVLGTAIPVSSADAQLNIEISTVDPLTKLPPDKWVYLMTHAINAAPLIGKEAVYAVNATGETLQAVTCRGYYLVGPKPYITNNKTTAAPPSLPPWTVTLVPADGFNSYCTAGVEAQGAASSYHGTLNSADRTFDSSTFVIFQKPNGQ
jgi:hypothetical protein